MAAGRKLTPDTETIEQRQAFEEYCKMGDERSLMKVADVVGKSPVTIQRWSKTFSWVNKVTDIDKAKIDTVTIESIADQMDSKKRNLKLIDAMLRDAAILDEDGNIKEGKIKLKSMSDIRTALEVREVLLGKDPKSKTAGGDTNIQQALFIIKKA